MPLDPEIATFLKAQGRAILSFSGGKDSLACWCALAELGVEVRPFYMAMIPGLSFVEDYLDYVGRYFGVPVMRTQHPNTYHWLRTYAGQPPHRKHTIDFLRLPRFAYEDVEQGVRRTLNQRERTLKWGDAWVAVGTRTTDSPQRRRSFLRLGWRRGKTRKVYPIHDFNKAMLIEVLVKHQVKLAPDYGMFGRSFDGVDFRYLDAIRMDYPQDYQRILEWMPLQDTEFHRVNFARKHGIATVT